jgi:hypothetical protein
MATCVFTAVLASYAATQVTQLAHMTTEVTLLGPPRCFVARSDQGPSSDVTTVPQFRAFSVRFGWFVDKSILPQSTFGQFHFKTDVQ